MDLAEHSSYDATGLAQLVKKREVTPSGLAQTALRVIETID